MKALAGQHRLSETDRQEQCGGRSREKLRHARKNGSSQIETRPQFDTLLCFRQSSASIPTAPASNFTGNYRLLLVISLTSTLAASPLAVTVGFLISLLPRLEFQALRSSAQGSSITWRNYMVKVHRLASRSSYLQTLHGWRYAVTAKRVPHASVIFQAARNNSQIYILRRALRLVNPNGALGWGLSTGMRIALAPTSDMPSPWLVLSAFVGLPAALWTYKVG